jgi:hypothetical protein
MARLIWAKGVVKVQEKIELCDPPIGRIVRKSEGVASHIIWEPGNGTKYSMVVLSAPSAMRDDVGGDVLVGFKKMNKPGYFAISWTWGNLFHLSYAAEKLGDDFTSRSDVLFYCALLNYVMTEDTAGYATDIVSIHEAEMG